MSITYITAELRRAVTSRADGLCEYCLIHEDDTFFGCQIDHIISEKHGGATELNNLAYACLFCNLHKGSDIASLTKATQSLSRFFNPRTDAWNEHFMLDEDGITILSFTPIGEVTSRIFEFNVIERLLERESLSSIGRYPSSAAKKRIAE